MFKGKSLHKVIDRLSKEKCLNVEIPSDGYLHGVASYFSVKNGTMWILEPSSVHKYEERNNIAYTLIDTNFKRGNQKWTQYMVVAFITEVMNNYMSGGIKELEISERYNVPVKRLEHTVSTFMSLHRTRYCLQNFFTELDFTLWRFRDIKTFDKLRKQNKVTDSEIKLLMKCNMIAFDFKSKEYIAINSLLDIIER